MTQLWDFISLNDPTVRTVVIGVLLIGLSSALIGNFTFLRKRAMIGDAISHSVFPGICLSFIIEGEKSPVSMLLFATIFGLGAMFLMDVIGRHRKIKPETSIGVVLATFFGMGVVLISYIQGNMQASQSGLHHYIFGNAAAMSENDIQVFAINTSVILFCVLLFFPGFKLVSFDRAHAKVRGLKVSFYESLLSILTVLAIAMGINAVGLVLMAALLITPASSARLWTNKLVPMMVIGICFSLISALAGTYVSYRYTQMPTGPWIVVFLSGLAFASILFAPGKGSIARLLAKRRVTRKIQVENVLKSLYKLDEDSGTAMTYSLDEINRYHNMDGKILVSALKVLMGRKMVKKQDNGWKLTDSGMVEGRRIVRVHRLWEMYLANKLALSEDHVHPSAESLEHFITPEMEQQLLEELDHPERGAHNDLIPKDD